MNKAILILAIFAFSLAPTVLSSNVKGSEDKDRELASINLGDLLGNLLGGKKNTTTTTPSTPATNTTNTTKPANNTSSSNNTSTTPVTNNTSSTPANATNSTKPVTNNTSSNNNTSTPPPSNNTSSNNNTSSPPAANNTNTVNNTSPTNATNTTAPVVNTTQPSNTTNNTAPVVNTTQPSNTTNTTTPVVNTTQPIENPDDSDLETEQPTNTTTPVVNNTQPSNTTNTTTPVTPAPAPVKYARNDVNMATFKDDCIRIHNDQRRYVGLNDLTWSDSLAASAQAWAENMAKNGFRHSGKTGENIASTSYSTWTLYRLFGLWTKEITSFIVGCKYPKCSNSTAEVGHYTQMVWKSTTQVGCGFAPGYNRGYNYLCCQYYKAGNIVGQYVY